MGSPLRHCTCVNSRVKLGSSSFCPTRGFCGFNLLSASVSEVQFSEEVVVRCPVGVALSDAELYLRPAKSTIAAKRVIHNKPPNNVVRMHTSSPSAQVLKTKT